VAEKSGGEFWAFLAGAVVGGVAALLYAPARGDETRRYIHETTDDLRHRGEDYYIKYRDEAEKYYELAKEKLEHLREELKHHAAQLEEAPEKQEEAEEEA
jgi:gas vesicle protein